ncbi:MAG: succinate dehydrogenase, cytochrome b556 subunit [Gammaproteobacteria bacterium]
MANDNRPLSPFHHYKPQLTSLLSFAHRLSGIALSVSAVGLVYWLVLLADGPQALESLEILATVPGQIVLAGVTLAFFYHLNNGIRHLFWDMGMGFEIGRTYLTGWLVLAATLLMWIAFWAAVADLPGGLP